MIRLDAFCGSCLLAAFMAIVPMHPAQAQETRRIGTIVVAHGGGEEWNQRVLETAAAATATGGPVEVSFLMGPGAATHRFQDVARRLETSGVAEIVVVPLLVSSHSGHYEQIRWLVGQTETLDSVMQHHLHMGGIERPRVTVPLRLAPAIDDAAQLAPVLVARAQGLAEDPAAQALLLVGHGPNTSEDLAAWMANLRRVAAAVRAASGFLDVRVGLVQDDAPPAVRAEAVARARDLVALQAALTRRPVVVVPILISRGPLGDQRIRADLDGLPIVYSGDPLLPHAEMTRWIEARVHETRRTARR